MESFLGELHPLETLRCCAQVVSSPTMGIRVWTTRRQSFLQGKAGNGNVFLGALRRKWFSWVFLRFSFGFPWCSYGSKVFLWENQQRSFLFTFWQEKNHRKTRGKPLENHGKMQVYPLVNQHTLWQFVKIATETMENSDS